MNLISGVPEGEYEASLVNTGGAISDQYFCLGTLLPLKFEVELPCSQIFYDWHICWLNANVFRNAIDKKGWLTPGPSVWPGEANWIVERPRGSAGLRGRRPDGGRHFWLWLHWHRSTCSRRSGRSSSEVAPKHNHSPEKTLKNKWYENKKNRFPKYRKFSSNFLSMFDIRQKKVCQS